MSPRKLGLRLSSRIAGIEMFVLHHRFTRGDDGTQYDSTMVFGMAGTLGRLVNPLLNRWLFGERHGHAWIKHSRPPGSAPAPDSSGDRLRSARGLAAAT